MTEKKKTSKKTSNEDKIAKARKKRLALAEERGKNKPQEKDNSREDFKKYFLKLQKKVKIDKSLEEVIWIHLKTIGCNKKEKFDEGVKHFGYKI